MIEIYDRVRDTTTVTGTGSATLLGAAAGYQSMASVLPSGGSVYYCIHAPTTGEWEVGAGDYDAGSGTLSRPSVLSSSTGGAAVDFAAGDKLVDIVVPADVLSRILPVGDLSIWVSTSGSDTATGTQSDPLASIQAALDMAVAKSVGMTSCTINIGAGDYYQTVVLPRLPAGVVGNLYSHYGAWVREHDIEAINCGRWHAYQIGVSNSGGDGWVVGTGGDVYLDAPMFGFCAGSHINVTHGGMVTQVGGEIMGGAASHIRMGPGGMMQVAGTISVTGIPAIQTFALLGGAHGNLDVISANYNGNATGQRYDVYALSVIDTGGAGSAHLPGDVDGATNTGGLYL